MTDGPESPEPSPEGGAAVVHADRDVVVRLEAAARGGIQAHDVGGLVLRSVVYHDQLIGTAAALHDLAYAFDLLAYHGGFVIGRYHHGDGDGSFHLQGVRPLARQSRANLDVLPNGSWFRFSGHGHSSSLNRVSGQ